MKLVDYVYNNDQTDPNEIENLISEIKAGFDYKFEPFVLPQDLNLYMVDVDSGSDTKVLVSAVLKWEKENRNETN